MDNLLIYNHLLDNEYLKICLAFLENRENENLFITKMLEAAEKYNLHNHLFQGLITYLLVNDENSFTLALERDKEINNTLKNVVLNDLEKIYHFFHYDFSFLNNLYKELFMNFDSSKPIINKEIYDLLNELQVKLSNTHSVDEFYEVLYNHYKQYGVAMYGLNKAFRYSNNQILPISHIGNETFDDLIGYENQKERLKENTENFLKGNKANNVLLYGDSGTGKSSSIKALLNTYYKDGLRMIEVYKHQFKDLPMIINELQNRNYYFIIFMDDLSFEDFEIEYKYLKAVIEGGLEKKPDNILIYATSNRRHLIKETWNERDTNEVNRNDAMQEKLSLVSRFGVQIMYIHPGKQQYLDIVDGLAEHYKISMDKEKLHALALQWEIRNGGYSGRNAKQFIHTILGRQ